MIELGACPSSFIMGSFGGRCHWRKSHRDPEVRRPQSENSRRAEGRRSKPIKMQLAREVPLIHMVSLLGFVFLLALLQTGDKSTSFARAQTPLGSQTIVPSLSSSLATPAGQPDAIVSKRDLSAKRTQNACQVNDGESVAILEIEESRGSDMTQATNPQELPISGQANEIELKIESETHKYFTIQNKRLRLTRPLDRDAVLKENSTKEIGQQPISSIYLQISCTEVLHTSEGQQAGRKVIIPVLVKVLDLNDNAPKFSQPVYTVRVDELTPVGSILLDSIQAMDLDSANNGQLEFALVGSEEISGRAPETRVSSVRLPARLFQRAHSETSSTGKPTSEPVSSGAPQPVDTTTGRWAEAGSSSSVWSETAPTSPASSTPAAASSTATSSAGSGRSSPTINLDSEPILNGPMEEGEDEEPDETLLAAMAGNSSSSTEEADADSEGLLLMLEGGSRRRKRSSQVAGSGGGQWPAGSSLESPNWTNLLNSNQDESGLQDLYARPDADWADYFSLELAQNNRPIIRLKKQLDYETRRIHLLHLQATDRASLASERRSTIAKVIVKVVDGDDQGPAFYLDQTGCATGAVPAQATSAPARHLGTERRPAIAKRQGEHLPKGFKVTEENFDFGDMSTGDELGPAEVGAPFESAGAGRPKRFPEPRMSTSAPRFGPTKAAHADDYSCLSISQPAGSNSGQAEYLATIMSGESDYLLRVLPQQIRARDRDELNAPIRYSFTNGTPANFSHYFHINPLDASIKQVAPVEASQVLRFEITVQAEEQTLKRMASVAKLSIEVLPSDKNPPVLIPNSYAAFVDENSPIGTKVFLSASNRSSLLKIEVLEEREQRQQQLYEFETTSEAFKVSREGFVFVNKWPLDRDPPNQVVHMFQVTARQIGLSSSRSLSSPVIINVTLLDLNDNPPLLANSSLAPIQMPASNRANGVRSISFVRATDLDEPENARMRFSIRHVSNNGRERFRINADTGELEALGKFAAGEQFSLTVQVADELERVAQGILELLVLPGPNSGGPQFVVGAEAGGDNSRGYSAQVNEGITPHSAVLQVSAVDPENDPISYSIISGNVNSDFYINSKSGLIQVANKLDREEVSAYQLMVQARDTGGLATNRPVFITVTDSNDENPTFERDHYVFLVDEGRANLTLGRLRATDNDLDENGLVSYQLAPSEDAALFQLDATSGELRLLAKLDYERAKQHSLIVTARDHGEKPRSSTASVLVKVQDVQDEVPFFERYHIEAKVPENQANFRLAQVQAKDLDSRPQVSYVMKSGDPSLFSVDAATGVVSTVRGLDFEQAQKYTIFVGTQEMDLNLDLVGLSEQMAAQQLERSPICRLDVTVLDVNDNAPRFVNQPLPVRIQDSAQLGALLTRLQAEDADGSEPNNLVRYELVTSENREPAGPASSGQATSEKCARSFMVDATSGAVSVKADLKRDAQSECQLLVRAFDQAREASLSSLASLTVYIDHLVEISPALSIGFADTSYTIELEENAPANSLVKIIPIINKPKAPFPVTCEISAGNELSKFFVLINEQLDCELRTRDPFLDYETRARYSLSLKLNTLGAGSLGQQARTLVLVNINILDKNDNKPVFQQVARYSHLTQNRFLAAIASDAPGESQLIQLKALDLDSPQANGLISYELLNDVGELENRFKVSPMDGIVRTSRPVEDIPSTRLPLRLRVLARDNPEVAGHSLESVAEVLVNLIEDRHRMALVLRETPTAKVLERKEEILSAIQERTRMIAGLEKAESLKLLRNNSLEADVGGTDFWFYLVEPGTFRLVPSDDLRVKGALLDFRAQNSLLDLVNQSLGLGASKVRLPYSLSGGRLASLLSSTFSRSFGPNGQTFASVLILVALFIALTSTIVVIYQCGFWSSYSRTAAAAAKGNSPFGIPNEKLYHPANAYFNQLPPQSNIPNSFTNKGFFGANQDYAYRSGFSTFDGQPEHSLMPQLISQSSRKSELSFQQVEQPQSVSHKLPSGAPAIPQALGKEYETQMLKMSVLFDDSNSLDEQNLNSNAISYAVLN